MPSRKTWSQAAQSSLSAGHWTMLKTTKTTFSASAASEKNARMAASLCFCWVRTASKHVGRAADEPGALPVVGQGAVDVGGVEEDEPAREHPAGVFAVEEEVLGGVGERVFVGPPGPDVEAGEDPAEVVEVAEAFRQDADRVLAPHRGGRDAARPRLRAGC